jgi:hypothetical protein
MSATTVAEGARPRRRRALAVLALVAAAAGAAALAIAMSRDAGGTGGAGARTAPPGTEAATVERGTLVARETVSGTLGYGDSATNDAYPFSAKTYPKTPGCNLRSKIQCLW